MWRRTHRRLNRVVWAAAVAVAAALLIVPSCSKKKKKPPGYLESLAGAKHMADETACRARLAQLWQALLSYATEHDGRFPPSRAELVESGLASRELFQCPKRSGPSYVYLPGQDQNMPPTNLLVFEEEAAHRGRCNVLRLGGTVESLTPEELAAARAKTQLAIGGS